VEWFKVQAANPEIFNRPDYSSLNLIYTLFIE